MIISDKWKDYEVIDTSCGEKLERWGSYLLIRPDPQVIWDTAQKDKRWRTPNGHYYRSDRGGGHWEFSDLPEEWQISYGSLKFNLKPFSFKHTGLFPEQAANWDYASDIIKKRKTEGRGTEVLNLFAYTGGATVSAAAAGAHNNTLMLKPDAEKERIFRRDIQPYKFEKIDLCFHTGIAFQNPSI